jgi:alpha-ketoglutarate-dependent taurine dioxygenase
MTKLTTDSGGDLVRFADGAGYPDIKQWMTENPHWENLLQERGHLVFRNFPVHDAATFDAVLNFFLRPSREFSEETSPRSNVSPQLFTSTDYPAEFPIQFHHEFSYRQNYPDRVIFYCLQAPRSGGATPIADSRKMLDRLSPDVVAKFERLGLAYVRNYVTGIGVSWTDAFGTSDKSAVSAYCEEHDIEYAWRGDELHTRQVAPAIRVHPVTGERTWFNSVLNLNVAGVEPKDVREALMSLPEDLLPINTTYGPGESIEPEIIEHIRESYAHVGVRFDWREADIMLIDNVLTAHAREPFEGERRILVGMGAAPVRFPLRLVLAAVGVVAEGEDGCLDAVLQAEFGQDAPNAMPLT